MKVSIITPPGDDYKWKQNVVDYLYYICRARQCTPERLSLQVDILNWAEIIYLVPDCVMGTYVSMFFLRKFQRRDIFGREVLLNDKNYHDYTRSNLSGGEFIAT